MHHRFHTILIFTSLFLLMTAEAQRSYQKNSILDAEKEDEQNQNNLRNEQLFLTNMGHSRFNPFINEHTLDWTNQPNLKSYGRGTLEKHITELNQIAQTPTQTILPPFEPTTPPIIPRRARISRFQMRRNKAFERRISAQTKEHMKRMKTHEDEGWYPRDVSENLQRLQWNDRPSLREIAQQRMIRSSCTGGKVWRRGQCRCPFRSNWDDEQSECVCIYGTYRDSKGNCRPFL